VLVEFDGARILASLDDLELAYALTVHKSQGDEFPCVVSIVHSSHNHMAHRNLLYTAVTRARRTSIIVGDPHGIRYAAQTVVASKRRTLLSVIPMAGEADRRPTPQSLDEAFAHAPVLD
jgi:exodeoxyribonuclease V alpha subunit